MDALINTTAGMCHSFYKKVLGHFYCSLFYCLNRAASRYNITMLGFYSFNEGGSYTTYWSVCY